MLRTVWLACVPPGHGCGALDPSKHNLPTSQSLQTVLFGLAVNFPVGQGLHVGSLPLVAYVPGKQAVHA